MVVGKGEECSSWVLIQEGGRHKNRVGGRVTDRVSTSFTCFVYIYDAFGASHACRPFWEFRGKRRSMNKVLDGGSLG